MFGDGNDPTETEDQPLNNYALFTVKNSPIFQFTQSMKVMREILLDY